MVSSLTELFCLDQGSNVQIRSNENVLLSGVNGQIPASFLALFASFSHHNSNKIRKKRRRIAWDSNQGLQDGSTQLWRPKLQGKRYRQLQFTLSRGFSIFRQRLPIPVVSHKSKPIANLLMTSSMIRPVNFCFKSLPLKFYQVTLPFVGKEITKPYLLLLAKHYFANIKQLKSRLNLRCAI